MDPVSTAELIASGWTGKKLLGPTFDAIGNDLKQAYEKGREKILSKAASKTDVKKSGQTNLRVTLDVLRNGTITDEEICAEYFGGILAASRDEDGKDDSGIFYLDIIKSLSSDQLRMHYIIYRVFNKHFLSNGNKNTLNPSLINQLQKEIIFFPLHELREQFRSHDFGVILHSLHAKDLIGKFHSNIYKLDDNLNFPYLNVIPTPIGIQLFAIAYNQLNNWRNIANFDFGDFEGVNIPKIFDISLEELVKKAKLEIEKS